MQIEEYFEIVSPDEIRVKGTRIGIEAILAEYFDGRSPEEIALNYPPLSLEQVHATITYYLHNRRDVDDYFARWAARGNNAHQLQEQADIPLLNRLRLARETPAQT